MMRTVCQQRQSDSTRLVDARSQHPCMLLHQHVTISNLHCLVLSAVYTDMSTAMRWFDMLSL